MVDSDDDSSDDIKRINDSYDSASKSNLKGYSSANNSTVPANPKKYKEQEFKEGKWTVNEVINNQRKYEVDVTSVDIFSLARHGKFP